jgi:D-alanyl-D-alanine carboxypeptidase/D-alanyl-D-alanine-endopeptidase (penicillin-binding protein 4)
MVSTVTFSRPQAAALFLLTALGACVSSGNADHLDQILRTEADPAVLVAAEVVDLDTGETLFSRHGRLLLRPASTMKLLTTASACRRWPGGHVETRLVVSSKTDGQVTLFGGGDPFLGSDDVAALVAELQRQGVAGCRGDITVIDPLCDADRFGEGWMWDDEPASFMPPISAAATDGGCATVELSRNENAIRAAIRPVAGDLSLLVGAAVGDLRITRGRYRDARVIRVEGALPEDSEQLQRRLTVPEPARHTGHLLAAALRAAGLLSTQETVTVRAATDADHSQSIAAVLRRPLAEVVHETNKVSDNLGAELLLRWIGAGHTIEALDAGATQRGIDAIGRDLRSLGLDPDGYRIADGSGVSHYTLISAECLVATLCDMDRRGGSAARIFRNSLPIAGRDGTLGSRMKGTEAVDRVCAKTGTISGVSNLAGYVSTRSGRRLAFAILVQNFVGPNRPWRQLQDRFCAALARL